MWKLVVSSIAVAMGAAVLVTAIERMPTETKTAAVKPEPIHLTPWQQATLDGVNAAQRRGDIALKKGDHAQACLQAKIQVSGWLELAGSLPKGTTEQEIAERSYTKLSDAAKDYCGF